MSQKTIPAPTQGRVVLFDASRCIHLPPDTRSYVVPAIIHRAVKHDLVTLWAVDDDNEPVRALGGGLPSANFGELRPGVPAPDCWCYPPFSEAKIVVEVSDEEPTFTP